MSTEAQFAACLLLQGPPDHIGWGRNEDERVELWDGDIQPCDNGIPISSASFEARCKSWWRKHVRPVGSLEPPHTFDQWYIGYKVWLLEARDEGRKRSSGNE